MVHSYPVNFFYVYVEGSLDLVLAILNVAGPIASPKDAVDLLGPAIRRRNIHRQSHVR